MRELKRSIARHMMEVAGVKQINKRDKENPMRTNRYGIPQKGVVLLAALEGVAGPQLGLPQGTGEAAVGPGGKTLPPGVQARSRGVALLQGRRAITGVIDIFYKEETEL